MQHPRPQRSKGHRHWRRWLIGFVVLSFILPSGALGLAQPAPEPLADAVQAAVRESGQRAPDGVHVVPAIERDGWSFGTAALIGTQHDDAPPEIVYYVAEGSGQRWEAAVEPTAAYDRMLLEAPSGVVPEVILANRADKAAGGRVWTGPGDLPLAMPFAPGARIQLLGGPHGDNGDANERPWAAIDLGVLDQSVAVLAAASGFATTPCAIEEDGGPLVMIEHPNGWRTFYFHLSGNTPLSKKVQRGDRLGVTSTESTQNGCFGTASGPHVHFSVRRMQGGLESEIPIKEVYLGGWQVLEGSAAYEGCLRQRVADPFAESSVATLCRNDTFLNNGVIGSGAQFVQIKPRPNLFSMGSRIEMTVRWLPVNTRVDIVLYHSKTDPNARRTVGSFRTGTGDKSTFTRFFVPRMPEGSGFLCLETRDLGKLACKHVFIKKGLT